MTVGVCTNGFRQDAAGDSMHKSTLHSNILKFKRTCLSFRMLFDRYDLTLSATAKTGLPHGLWTVFSGGSGYASAQTPWG